MNAIELWLCKDRLPIWVLAHVTVEQRPRFPYSQLAHPVAREIKRAITEMPTLADGSYKQPNAHTELTLAQWKLLADLRDDAAYKAMQRAHALWSATKAAGTIPPPAPPWIARECGGQVAGNDVVAAQHQPRKRGRRAEKQAHIVALMESDVASGHFTIDALRAEKEEALASRYTANRETVRKARDVVMTRAAGCR